MRWTDKRFRYCAVGLAGIGVAALFLAWPRSPEASRLGAPQIPKQLSATALTGRDPASIAMTLAPIVNDKALSIGLSNEASERFASQVSHWFASYTSESCDYFRGVFQSWGGKPRDPEAARRLDDLWPHPSGRIPIRKVDAQEARVVRLDVIRRGDDVHVDLGKLAVNAMGAHSESMFEYPGDASAMLREGADVVALISPVEGSDGVVFKLGAIMIWSSERRQWRPFLLWQQAHRGDGVVTLPF